MKKLTKKSLEELAKTMSVIPEDERDNYWGMYGGDCFWRCVSYKSGTGDLESAAASYALNYLSDYMGSTSANDFLTAHGAGITIADARRYVQNNSLGNDILYCNPSDIAAYSDAGYQSISGSVHYVVRLDANTIYDPQLGRSFDVRTDASKFVMVR